MAFGEKKELAQWERRRNHTMSDQHGRKWETTLDFIANGPCGPINPKGWSAPLSVHTKYLKFQPEDASNLLIEYDRWIEDTENAWKDYDTRLYNDAIMLFGAQGPKAYREKSPELVRHTGPSPEPVELIKAARAGNKWVLGLKRQDGSDYPIPEWAEPFIRKAEVAKEEFPDVEDLDRYGDIEEEFDPKAVGGKRVNPRATKTKEVA